MSFFEKFSGRGTTGSKEQPQIVLPSPEELIPLETRDDWTRRSMLPEEPVAFVAALTGEDHTEYRLRLSQREAPAGASVVLITFDVNTDIGGPHSKYKDRGRNEDAILFALGPQGQEAGLVTADGAGGSDDPMAATETMIASARVEFFSSARDSTLESRMRQFFRRSEDDIHRDHKGKVAGYGCASAALVDCERREFCGGTLGDTRLLFIREDANGKVSIPAKTAPHNFAAVTIGSQAMTTDFPRFVSHTYKSTLTRYIGYDREIDKPPEYDDPEIISYTAQAGETITVLTYSDGIGDWISDMRVLQLYLAYQGNPRALEQHLFDEAMKINESTQFEMPIDLVGGTTVVRKPIGGDNITIGVMQVRFPS